MSDLFCSSDRDITTKTLLVVSCEFHKAIGKNC